MQELVPSPELVCSAAIGAVVVGGYPPRRGRAGAAALVFPLRNPNFGVPEDPNPGVRARTPGMSPRLQRGCRQVTVSSPFSLPDRPGRGLRLRHPLLLRSTGRGEEDLRGGSQHHGAARRGEWPPCQGLCRAGEGSRTKPIPKLQYNVVAPGGRHWEHTVLSWGGFLRPWGGSCSPLSMVFFPPGPGFCRGRFW